MIVRRFGGRLVVCALALALVAAACGDDAGEQAEPGGDASGDYPEVVVTVKDNSYDPQTVEVEPGTVVRWVNEGRNTHNVLPDEGDLFGSPDLDRGEEYSFRFDDPGEYSYYCSFHGAPGKGQYGKVVVKGGASAAGGGGRPGGGEAGTIRVPEDAGTIQEAVDRASPGTLILVSPGVYEEAVTVTTDNLVIRGLDRNEVILDGGFELENGIKVVGANGVAVENMTARNYVGNGFFWTGVTGYRASYLTAYRNGDYGIYAFDSVKGQFDHSYASGHPDSGFYIGQCYPCDAVITDVIAEHSQMGYSGTNAGGNLLIVSSIWRHNRIGIVPNTLDSEEEPPQREVVIAGNLVYDNNDPDAPNAKSSDFDILFGSGITVVGGVGDVVERNRVEGHELFGIVIAPNPGLQENFWPSQRNQVRDNVVRGSGMADLAIALFSPDDGNCFAGNDFGTSAPANLEQLMPCEGAGSGDPEAGAADVEAVLGATHPKGKPWQESPIPPDQPNMPDAATAEPRPATDVPMRVDLASITVPDPQG